MSKEALVNTSMKSPMFIGLVRVSTGRQEESGLGLSAQRSSIDIYIKQHDGMLIRTYEEIKIGFRCESTRRNQISYGIDTCIVYRYDCNVDHAIDFLGLLVGLAGHADGGPHGIAGLAIPVLPFLSARPVE